MSCPNLILDSDGNLNGVSYLLQALFERPIRNSMLDPTGRKALPCQSLPEFTSELHARSCYGHMSRDRLQREDLIAVDCSQDGAARLAASVERFRWLAGIVAESSGTETVRFGATRRCSLEFQGRNVEM
jgi:hypothetical protein